MWQILCVLSAIAFGLAPVEFTPEEQEYFERFTNCRSACEVFCEYAGQGNLECHKQCFLTFCYKRPTGTIPQEIVDAAVGAAPMPEETSLATPETTNAEADAETLLDVDPAILNLFSESMDSFRESSAEDTYAADNSEPIEDTHAGHGHAYWPAS